MRSNKQNYTPQDTLPTQGFNWHRWSTVFCQHWDSVTAPGCWWRQLGSFYSRLRPGEGRSFDLRFTQWPWFLFWVCVASAGLVLRLPASIWVMGLNMCSTMSSPTLSTVWSSCLTTSCSLSAGIKGVRCHTLLGSYFLSKPHRIILEWVGNVYIKEQFVCEGLLHTSPAQGTIGPLSHYTLLTPWIRTTTLGFLRGNRCLEKLNNFLRATL